MDAPTQPVTVNLADFGGPAVDGVKVTAQLNVVDRTESGVFVSTKAISALTVAGVAVLNCFPNALVANGGLGTVGSSIRFRATIPDSRPLDVQAAIPNTPCNLVDYLIDQEPNGLGASELAASRAEAARDAASGSATAAAGSATAGAGSATAAAGSATAAAGSATAASGSATAAAGSATSASGSAAAAAASATTSTAAAASATIAALIKGAYPASAQSNVPRGLTQASVGAITAGAGGTNGTFALAFSAGTGWIYYPTGTFTVAGNVLTAVTITGPGLCINAAPTVPTVSFAASAGLAGAAVALTLQFLVAAGEGYWAQSTDANSLVHCINNAGAAVVDNSVGPISTTNLLSIVTEQALPGDTEVTVDSLGYVLTRLTDRGRVGKTPSSIVSLPALGTVMHHFLDYGQSLANGWNAKPVITTSGMFDDVWMFNGGVNTAETSETAAVSMASLTAYFEQNQGTNSGETPNGGRVARLVQLLRERHGKTLKDFGAAILCSSAAKDGAQINALQKGSTYYARIINQVTQGKALATAAGYTYKLGGIFFDQGQFNSGTAIATYLGTFQTTGTGGNAGLYNLHFDLQADLRTVLGDAGFNLKMYLTTTWIDTGLAAPNSHAGSTLAQLKAHQDNPDKFAIVGTAYQQNTIDGTHWQAFESGLAGAYGAEAYMEEVIYGGKWQCVEPIAYDVSGAVVTIRFRCPGGQLLFDTKQVRLATNFGFLCTDRTGAAYTHVGLPVIVGADRVQITLSGAPGSGLRVKYGDLSTQLSTWAYVGPFRRMYGNRGNLRDNSGDLAGGIYRHPSNRFAPMHRWCVQFDTVVIA